MWVLSKNESNCLLENKMVSTLIWRNVILLYVVKSNILWLTFKLSYHYRCNILCTVSFLLYIATKKLKQNHYCKQFYECSYHKKITLARFACLRFKMREGSNDFACACVCVEFRFHLGHSYCLCLRLWKTRLRSNKPMNRQLLQLMPNARTSYS